MALIDITGQTFGYLTVIERAKKPEGVKNRNAYWKCKCKCGNIEDVISSRLKIGEKQCCNNCSKEKRKIQYINEVDNKYGKLTVLEYDKQNSNKQAKWICKCDCGNIISVKGTKLRFGQKSCGCEKSKGELKINQLLSTNHILYKTQIAFPNCKNIKELKFDFGVYDENNQLKYLIEYDGEQHFIQNDFFNSSLEENQLRDNIKNQFCIDNNIPLIRIPYTQYNQLTIKDLNLEESEFIINEKYKKNDYE